MQTKEPHTIIFFLLSVCIIWMWVLLLKNKKKRLFFFYNLFFTIGFYTPVLYYFLGNIVYSHAFSQKAINIYCLVGITFSLFTIFWTKTRLNSNKFLFLNFFNKFRNKNFHKSVNVRGYFIFVTCIMVGYLIFFINDLPLLNILSSQGGEEIERLDRSGEVPYYILFSSLFIVLFPTIFFYFFESNSKKIYKILFFILTVFAIGAGGNKGIITYFFIFFLFFFSKKRPGFFKMTAVVLVLFSYYLFTKGVDFSDKEVVLASIESPFRRFFVTQPVGFIVRIQMFLDNSFDVNSSYSIKHQIFSIIYQLPLGFGSHPSHFVSSVLIKYGFIVMFGVFFLFNLFLLELIKSSDKVLNNKTYGFIIWNIFIFMFLMFNSDLSVANYLRFAIIFTNLLILNFFIANEKRI